MQKDFMADCYLDFCNLTGNFHACLKIKYFNNGRAMVFMAKGDGCSQLEAIRTMLENGLKAFSDMTNT
jgi:hypothetical protein